MIRKYGQYAGLMILAVVVALLATELETWARAGGGGSFGSRGFRSYSSPSRNYYSPRPSAPPPTEPTNPYGALMPSSSGGGFMRSLAGGMLTDLLVGILFRSLGFEGYDGMG